MLGIRFEEVVEMGFDWPLRSMDKVGQTLPMTMEDMSWILFNWEPKVTIHIMFRQDIHLISLDSLYLCSGC